MRFTAAIFLLLSPALAALNLGELQFVIGGKKYNTTHAQGIITTKNGRVRIHIAVKDIDSRFMLVLTADVAKGEETKPLTLTTQDSALGVTLRTMQGSMAVLPHQQLAQINDLTYTERVQVETDQLEQVPEEHGRHGHSHGRLEKKFRKKIRSEYRKVRPRWHTMSAKERLATGEGVIENGAFRDAFLSLQLIPVVSGGKVVSYDGSFAGSGRFSKSISGAEIKPIQGGVFSVKVQSVP